MMKHGVAGCCRLGHSRESLRRWGSWRRGGSDQAWDVKLDRVEPRCIPDMDRRVSEIKQPIYCVYMLYSVNC